MKRTTTAIACSAAALALGLSGCGASFEGSGSKDAASAEQLALRTDDGAIIESVLIAVVTGDGHGDRSRATLCVSSQVGCALECTFCSTGRQGFNRNLSTAEIIGQLWWANKSMGVTPKNERVISNVVMMGMGEPLANYDNVVAAMRIMLDDHGYGLSRRRVTLSTSGLVPAMDRLREDCPVALAVSLHAPNDRIRDEIVPINKKYPLRELLAVISAHEWRKKGVPVAATGGRIHPHYGVFSPVRGEYVDLLASAPIPAGCNLAFDIGTGSGIIAAVLARRGVKEIVATDQDARALACAVENVERLGLAAQVSVIKADLFPEGKAPLVVCNPPWLPAEPTSPVEYAVYDPDSRMLRGFLAGLAAHLAEGGEGWLVISDIAELLGLRSRQQLLAWIDGGGLQVLGRLDTRPKHPKAQDASDPLHAARAAEVTSLWRLGKN